MLVQKIQNNDFKDIQFSYDLHGRPQNIYVKVYVNGLTFQFDLPAFEFTVNRKTVLLLGLFF